MIKAKSIKRFTKTLQILLIIEALLLSVISIYYYFEYAKKVPVIRTDTILNQPIEFNFTSLHYNPLVDETTPLPLSKLDVFPQNYNKVVEKLGEIPTQHQKTELLLYSQSLLPSRIESLSQGYEYLLEKEQNILIPKEYVNIHFISKIYSVAEKIQNEQLNRATKERLKDLLFVSNSPYISECTPKDLNLLILQGGECTVQTELLLNNISLSNLNRWLLFNQSENITLNDFEKYVNKHLYLYTVHQTRKEYTPILQKSDTFSYYLDIDRSHLHKMEYIYNYLKTVYEQTGQRDTLIERELEQISLYLSSLINYIEAPQDPVTTESLQPFVGSIVKGPSIELPEKPVHPVENISWYLRSIQTEQGDEIYVAPIYKFKDSTEGDLLSFTVSDENFDQDYEVEPIKQKKNSVRVPILMYHHIADIPKGSSTFKAGLYVTPKDFEKQVAYLVKHNYKTVTPKELYNLLKTGKNPTQKSVMLTFDDSVLNHYTTAYPILKKYGLTGVFYTVSMRSSISSNRLKEMADSGMIIGSHSATHIDLIKINDIATLSYEVVSSKSHLTARTGESVDTIAYPGCVADKEVFGQVTSAGYLIGTSCGREIDHYFSNRLYLSRVHVFTDMKRFINLLSGIN